MTARTEPVPMTFTKLLLSLVFIALLFPSCGTSHAILELTAPATVVAGVPFTITVTVMYGGKRDTIINSPVHFTSSDPAAVLAGDYYFTPADAGSHTFTNAFTLSTPGNQSITAAITGATGINGAANIAVSATMAENTLR
jgi:hypothetical protein